MKMTIKYFLVLVLASFVLAGCCTMHNKIVWEYRSVDMDPDKSEQTLNDMSKEGWTLVSVVPDTAHQINDANGQGNISYYCAYIFKRPKH